MTFRAASSLTVCAVVAILTMPVNAAGQESLDAARQLYASADYHVALSMLDSLLAANPASQERQSLELYRAFCLVALGSNEDATTAIEAMIRRDPLYQPDMEEVPPRLRALFNESRRRLLPAIIQQRYVLARTAFDRRDYQTATDGFMQVMLALSDPVIALEAGQPPLADLGLLATNFNDLAVRALTPPAPAPKAEPPPPAASAPSTPVTLRTEVFSMSENGVVPPVVIRQSLPPFPGRSPVARTGILDIVIDTTGAVESAEIVEPLHPAYNRIVLAATKNWAFQPARRDGVPVRYRKRIEIAVAAGGSP